MTIPSPRSSRRVLFQVMRGPQTREEIADALNLAPSTVGGLIQNLRKKGVKIYTVGIQHNYKYEYGGRNVSS